LQPLSLAGNVLQFDLLTSDVELQPLNSSNLLQQSLVFDAGRFINTLLGKMLSVNNGVLTADTNDTRGANAWTIGRFILKLNDSMFL
jgi:hypothetical protein